MCLVGRSVWWDTATKCGDMIGEIPKLLLAQGELLERAVGDQLRNCWDDISDLLEEANDLITDFEDGKLQREVKFIDLEEKLETERARFHIWLDLAHL